MKKASSKGKISSQKTALKTALKKKVSKASVKVSRVSTEKMASAVKKPRSVPRPIKTHAKKPLQASASHASLLVTKKASPKKISSKMVFDLSIHSKLIDFFKPFKRRLDKLGLKEFNIFLDVPAQPTARPLKKHLFFVILPLSTIMKEYAAMIGKSKKSKETSSMVSENNKDPEKTMFLAWLAAMEMTAGQASLRVVLTYTKAQIKRVTAFPKDNSFIFIDESALTSFELLAQLISRETEQFLRFHRAMSLGKSQKGGSTRSEEEIISKEIFKIGLNLSKERDTVKILEEILENSMRLTRADAGSVAIRGMDKALKKTKDDVLTFYISKNISRELHFSRFTMPVSEKSLGGYTVMTGEPLNIEDAYLIGEDKTYSFNRDFDRQTNFRTKSMLVVPMVNQKEETIGIIQLINKKRHYAKVIDYKKFKKNAVLAFTKEDAMRLKALASLATVSLQNAILYNEIDNLFRSFVEASVSAVEQRDPATSGHSFRVAKFSILLAETCSAAGGVFDDWFFSTQQLRELEYASLLHDFGKIGVRENILLKSHKIENNRFAVIIRKFDVKLLNLQIECQREILKIYHKGVSDNLPLPELEHLAANVQNQYQEKIDRFTEYKKIVEHCNESGKLTEEFNEVIGECADVDVDGVFFKEPLLTKDEHSLLSIPYGTLSHKERSDIQSHVSYTFEFLKRIPWTEELKNIPDIAHAHHEKLDGTGYPIGIKEDQIPNQSKIMTICDIYDALTASDRPYKKSIEEDRAIEILKLERKDGKLHGDLLELFIRNPHIRHSMPKRKDFAGSVVV